MSLEPSALETSLTALRLPMKGNADTEMINKGSE